MRPAKFMWKRIMAEALNLLELLFTLLKLVARLKLQTENPFRGMDGEYSGEDGRSARNVARLARPEAREAHFSPK